jgi:uncharacterized membrane protein
MSKFVVVVLPDEKKAYEALHSIQVLHKEGTITFYAASIIERKPDGQLEVKQAVDEGPLGLATGALVGGLIGLLGGPLGAAMGLATGGMVGSLRDYAHAGVSEDFIETVTGELAPGKFAVIAEVSEDWVTPIDVKMEALGGKVVRAYRDEFVDDLIEKRADTARSELEQRKAERAGAKAEKMGTQLEKHIDQARRDLQRTASEARERLEKKKAETQAKIEALEEQAGKADPEMKARIEQRIAEIRSDLSAREQKLHSAFELVEQALL